MSDDVPEDIDPGIPVIKPRGDGEPRFQRLAVTSESCLAVRRGSDQVQLDRPVEAAKYPPEEPRITVWSGNRPPSCRAIQRLELYLNNDQIRGLLFGAELFNAEFVVRDTLRDLNTAYSTEDCSQSEDLTEKKQAPMALQMQRISYASEAASYLTTNATDWVVRGFCRLIAATWREYEWELNSLGQGELKKRILEIVKYTAYIGNGLRSSEQRDALDEIGERAREALKQLPQDGQRGAPKLARTSNNVLLAAYVLVAVIMIEASSALKHQPARMKAVDSLRRAAKVKGPASRTLRWIKQRAEEVQWAKEYFAPAQEYLNRNQGVNADFIVDCFVSSGAPPLGEAVSRDGWASYVKLKLQNPVAN